MEKKTYVSARTSLQLSKGERNSKLMDMNILDTTVKQILRSFTLLTLESSLAGIRGQFQQTFIGFLWINTDEKLMMSRVVLWGGA